METLDGYGHPQFCQWETWAGGHLSCHLLTPHCQVGYSRVARKQFWHRKRRNNCYYELSSVCFSGKQRQWTFYSLRADTAFSGTSCMHLDNEVLNFVFGWGVKVSGLAISHLLKKMFNKTYTLQPAFINVFELYTYYDTFPEEQHWTVYSLILSIWNFH